MNKSEWEKGLAEWERVKVQANINLEQADLYITAIKKKIKSLPKSDDGVNKNGK